MAVTLAPDELRDAEITDGIGRGDAACAARLWVRYWPTALAAARQFVDPEEVPGLAAEALIGTITAVAIGRGPREDVAGFVADAVRELGEDDEPAPASTGGYPDLFVSAAMTDAFAALEPETQQALAAFAHGEPTADGTRALTVLQHYYLAEHADRARSATCRRVHIALMSIADGSAREGLSGDTWLHLSTCAWCTEAFHEVAFSNVALDALIAPAVLAAAVAPAAPEPADELFDEPAVALASTVPDEPEAPEALYAREAPYAVELFDTDPFESFASDEEDDDAAAVLPPPEEPVRRRGRLIAALVLAAAVVAVLAVVVTGLGNGDPAPTAANTLPTETATTGSPTGTASVEDPVTPTLPTGSATVAPPEESPAGVPVVTPAAPTTTTTPKASGKPTTATSAPKPTSTPTSSSAPTTAPPTSSPTSSPTKRCNGLQHLLGIC